uniref:Uncharacterized protein n=1 Tax=Percolomonas cosmopolitus TaxID=63605 RepID=A0A7S1KKQ5_9EUKA
MSLAVSTSTEHADVSNSSSTTLMGKISFRPSHYSTLVQYGYTIESNILSDFSGSNFSYSFRINHDGEVPKPLPQSLESDSSQHNTHTSKTPIKSLKIKLWKLELKTVRKSVQFQKKLLIKLKVNREEWERNPVSEWKISAGDIKLELHEKVRSEESATTDGASSQTVKEGRRKSALNRSSLHSTRHNGNLFNSIQLYQQQQKKLLGGEESNLDAHLDKLTGDVGCKLDRIEASAQTLIVALQKRPNYRASLKKHRLSTTNITKNLFSDNTSNNKSLTTKDDIALRRRSLSSPANSNSGSSKTMDTLATLTITPPPKASSARKSPTPKPRRTPLKIIATDDNLMDSEEGTPQTPASPISVRSSVDSFDSFSFSTASSRSRASMDGTNNRNSDSNIPKWAQRALSPASTPSTMKKQRFVDRTDPESYAYIMYFIQGSQDQVFTSFTKFCSSILFVGAGSPSHNPFSVHFSSMEHGSQYSLTERLFRMEQHNSRVSKTSEKYRLFMVQLPTCDYPNEQWVMAHLRQASMLQALCSPIEGYWKKPLKHLNSFKTCPTIDNTSIVMNESVVEFNKVLRYERIQFGLNMLKIAFVRAQSESIELDLDVKWIERDRRRGSMNESVRIMDTNRYKLYFSKNDQAILSTIENTMNL